MPELAHWFGIQPEQVDGLTLGELREFISRLNKCPPIGAVFMVATKD